MFLPAILSVVTIQALAGAEASPKALPAASEQDAALDLRLGGHPLQGQPLTLEVRGPAATSFLVRLDFLPTSTGEPDAASAALPADAFPGSRAASLFSRLRADQTRGRFLPGKTDAAGFWSRPLEAPLAGTEILARGYAVRAGLVQEFEALELDILAPYSARAGDVSLVVDAREPLGAARVELENHTDFTLDLAGWTLHDDRGRFEILPEDLRLPARGSILAPSDAFVTRPTIQEIVLVDGQSQVIQRASPSLTVPGSSIPAGIDDRNEATPGTHRIGPYLCDVHAVDVPDLDFEDTNCDGIDGDVARAVFVATTGSPSNPGTMALPVDDVNAAIAIAAAHPFKDHVYVSEGDYAGLITIPSGVSVWGGYSAAHGWARSNAYVTTFSVGGLVSGDRVGVRGTGLLVPMTLGNVTVTTSDAPTGRHNYGILFQNSANVTLEGVTVVAGAGGAASNGTAGLNGFNGAVGFSGGSGGGSGGGGAWSGGHGGAGGGFLQGGSDGQDGNGTFGGAGGSGGGLGANGSAGNAGFAGSNGGGGGPRSNDGAVSGGFWNSNGDGFTGFSGATGNGGGGGGGGGGGVLNSGGGGGGGGGSGSGGNGGTGGTAGGTSFGVFLSSTTASIRSCNLTAGIGRTGGNGGNGGTRGLGASGGNGGVGGASNGGHGGAGGNGGQGGGGAGGGGGHSYAILVGPSSSLSSLQSTTLSTSTPGTGGAGGQGPGLWGQVGNPGEAVAVKTL